MKHNQCTMKTEYADCLEFPIIDTDVFDITNWQYLLKNYNWDDQSPISLALDVLLTPREIVTACRASINSYISPFVIIGNERSKQFIAFVLIIPIPSLYSFTSIILKYQDINEREDKLICGYCEEFMGSGDVIEIIRNFYPKQLVVHKFGVSQQYLMNRHLLLDKPTITYDMLRKYPWTTHSPSDYDINDDGIYENGEPVYPSWILNE